MVRNADILGSKHAHQNSEPYFVSWVQWDWSPGPQINHRHTHTQYIYAPSATNAMLFLGSVGSTSSPLITILNPDGPNLSP